MTVGAAGDPRRPEAPVRSSAPRPLLESPVPAPRPRRLLVVWGRSPARGLLRWSPVARCPRRPLVGTVVWGRSSAPRLSAVVALATRSRLVAVGLRP